MSNNTNAANLNGIETIRRIVFTLVLIAPPVTLTPQRAQGPMIRRYSFWMRRTLQFAG